eukprot:TRINITY_DN9106_c0_g1_i1.p1 TRINITY_DN9106_c0_g1~~TRINITY_DN9106_c0_g1_i1.p1  ORF type:complete len:446 (-),score=71.81 TRINITY_DN9106_c0_g1_i1:211-1548(-)
MWSGRHINQIQAWSNDKGLPSNYTPIFTDTLGQSGYYNYLRGKEDYTSGDHSESGNVMDWTRSVPFVNISIEPRPTTVLKEGAGPYVETGDWNNTQKFAKWLHEDAKNNQPYFAYLGLDIPHPLPTRDLNFQHVDVGGDSTFGTSDYYLPSINTSLIKIPKWVPWNETHPVDRYQSITKNVTGEWTEAEIVQIRQYYYAMCMELDGMLGVLIKALQQSGTENNTYVFFTSDHGELAMEHRQYYKMSAYEGSSHVPLVITGPGVKKNIVNAPVSLVDIYPTLCDIANSTLPPLLNGTSLLPFLNPNLASSAPPVRPDYILSQYHGAHSNASWFMLRTGDYKYIAYGSENTPPQLFDLTSDPDELIDLSKTQPDVVSALDEKLYSIIDYPAVTKQVDAYNRATLEQWKLAQGSNYTFVLSTLQWFWDWSKDPVGNVKLIDQWLDGEN